MGWKPGNAFDEPRTPGSETVAYPQEHAGHGGSDAPPSTEAAPGDGSSDAPATAPDWLNEETKSGLPMAVKILILRSP